MVRKQEAALSIGPSLAGFYPKTITQFRLPNILEKEHVNGQCECDNIIAQLETFATSK
jgi:hypothetical protein